MSERSAVYDSSCRPESPPANQHRSVPSLDRVLDILAADYRRQVVDCLARRDETVAFDSLVRSVTAKRVDEGTDLESTRIALYHTHLPKLVDTGVIEFDREAETVGPGPRLEGFRTSLATIEDHHAR